MIGTPMSIYMPLSACFASLRETKLRTAGRPAGSKTRYPGIMTFSRSIGVSHQFVRSVLDGIGVSSRVTREWRKWQERHEAV